MSSIDKAMYYDALPTRSYCGLFFFPSFRTTPCYEAFRAWNELAKLGTSVSAAVEGKSVYAAAAKGSGKRAFLIANVGDSAASVTIRAEGTPYSLYRVDADHARLTADGPWREGAITIPSNGLVLALSGTLLEGAEKAKVKQGAVNGLQQ